MTLIELKQYAIDVVNGRKKIIDSWHYTVGNYRYKLFYNKKYYTKKHPLMQRHIWEQIQYRIRVMNRECYLQGACIKCGCLTTALQMCYKKCEGNCYPTMLNRREWDLFKNRGVVYDTGCNGWWIYSDKTDKYTLHIETATNIIPTEIQILPYDIKVAKKVAY